MDTWLDSIGSFFLRFIRVLPDSFVNSYVTNNNFEFLGFLNWVIPFYDFVDITTLWLAAMIAVFAGRVSVRFGSAISSFFRKG